MIHPASLPQRLAITDTQTAPVSTFHALASRRSPVRLRSKHNLVALVCELLDKGRDEQRVVEHRRRRTGLLDVVAWRVEDADGQVCVTEGLQSERVV